MPGEQLDILAPELIDRSIEPISPQTDVYSFELLIIENKFGSKRGYNQFRKEKDIEVQDETHDDEKKMIKKLILVALWCIQINLLNRPSMEKVVEMREGGITNLGNASQAFWIAATTSTGIQSHMVFQSPK